jgi:hypothetical protein
VTRLKGRSNRFESSEALVFLGFAIANPDGSIVVIAHDEGDADRLSSAVC